jgi:hypothetical protein
LLFHAELDRVDRIEVRQWFERTLVVVDEHCQQLEPRLLGRAAAAPQRRSISASASL